MSAPSDFFSTITVQDDRIQAISDNIQYSVIKGASSNNPIQNAATSISTSSIVFNQPIPSETTIVDRRIMIKTQFLFKLQKKHTSQTRMLYPQSWNFAPFPLHQLTQTLSLTLNNTSVSTQIKDILPAMLRCMDTEDLYEYNSLCPTSFDRYARYSDEAYAHFDTAPGTFAEADITHLQSGAINSYSNFQGFKGLRDEFIPRGAYAIDGYFSDAAGNTSITQADVVSKTEAEPFYVKITTFEPVLISPLVWGKNKGQAGMYGLQNIILQYTLSADASRAIRSVNNIETPQLQAILSSEIHMNFLTPQPSTLLNARNVLPHYQIDRLVSSFPNNVPTAFNASAGAPIQSQTFTLSVIPDYIVVYIRPPTSKLAHYKSDSFASISALNIQFANTSGILSTAQINNLYQISHENGYNGSFLEWANRAHGSGSNAGHLSNLPTSGSVCILRFGKDINLPEFAAPGCVGNWSLKIDVVAKQTYDYQFVEETWSTTDFTSRANGTTSLGMELNILAVMSGCMVLERGQSSVHLGLLTRQDALDAANDDTVGFQGSQRLVGKGFFDGLGSVFGKVKDFASNALGTVKQMAPLIKMGATALGKPGIANTLTKVGLGKTGGADYSGNNLSHRIA